MYYTGSVYKHKVMESFPEVRIDTSYPTVYFLLIECGYPYDGGKEVIVMVPSFDIKNHCNYKDGYDLKVDGEIRTFGDDMFKLRSDEMDKLLLTHKLEYCGYFSRDGKAARDRILSSHKRIDNEEDTMELEVKYISKEIDKLEYIDGEKSNWIDLRCAKTTILHQYEAALIPLGIAVRIPVGYEAHMVPRSSLYKNYGVIQTNGVGIIDNSYCGDNDQWYMPVLAMRDTTINLNDRIAQFRIVKNQPKIVFAEKEHLSNIDRGGIGSTGVQ